jgi:hypothetical protein
VVTDEYLTVAEVAARLKLRVKTVRNRMYDGTWRRGEHWFSQPGISPRFKWSVLVRWLEGGADEQGKNDGLAYGPDIPRDRPRRLRVDRDRREVRTFLDHLVRERGVSRSTHGV